MQAIDTTTRDAIVAAVDTRRDAIADELLQLVGVSSVTGNEEAVQAIVDHLFRQRDLAVDRCCSMPTSTPSTLASVRRGPTTRPGNWSTAGSTAAAPAT